MEVHYEEKKRVAFCGCKQTLKVVSERIGTGAAPGVNHQQNGPDIRKNVVFP